MERKGNKQRIRQTKIKLEMEREDRERKTKKNESCEGQRNSKAKILFEEKKMAIRFLVGATIASK